MSRPYQMIVIGDSLLSGQGLREEQKIHRLAATFLADRVAARDVECSLYAHSGAVVGLHPLDSKLIPTPHIEVPVPEPTVLQQIENCAALRESTDLALINGGAVDTNLASVLNPLTSVSRLRPVIDRIFRQDMRVALARLAARCPRARIVVVPYYRILSAASNLELLSSYLAAQGVLPAQASGARPPWLSRWAHGRIVENCAFFARQSTEGYRIAAAAVNAAVGGSRVVVADVPPFPEHAALTPDPWLFGVSPDMSPQDEVVMERRAACHSQFPPGVNRARCCRASAGHLNPTGARFYADAVMRALEHPEPDERRPAAEGMTPGPGLREIEARAPGAAPKARGTP